MKSFYPTTWSIKNRTFTFVITLLLASFGYVSYNSLPKENFPDITIPQVIITTPYPGTSPENIETLVTIPIEKEIKSINGLKNVTSSSLQDMSMVVAEFESDVSIEDALQKVRDAIDKAKPELPSDLPDDPNISDINFSDFPIMYVNIFGDYDLVKLKDYADILKDNIEILPEISKVEMVGALEPEIQVEVDLFKMQAAKVSFKNIEDAIRNENINSTAGEIHMGNFKRSLNIKKLFRNADDLGEIFVKNGVGGGVFLKDIAEIKDGTKEQESFSRLNGKNVITLNVSKRSGENIVSASEAIESIIDKITKSNFPKGVKVVITGDQSTQTKSTLNELVNSIIIGFILVSLVLMFFMGISNALFVALAIPLSCAIAFLVFPNIGFSLNMIVLFSFLLALGLVVDQAIVVIENTYRIFNNGETPIEEAATKATGEVFFPVLSGAVTTILPFLPLAFWPGIIGDFMSYLPITLMITLTSSLIVAYIINPVFAVSFMKPINRDDIFKPKFTQGKRKVIFFLAVAAAFGYLISFGLGNLIVFIILFYLFSVFYLAKIIIRFQEIFWVSIKEFYVKVLKRALKSPGWVFSLFVFILLGSFVITAIKPPKIVFFPESDPNRIYVYVELLEGTHQDVTNRITLEVEKEINKVLKKDKQIVKSINANVTKGVDSGNGGFASGDKPNKGMITISFVEFSKRHGVSTKAYLDSLRNHFKTFKTDTYASIVVEKEQSGPPTGKPISIEIMGNNIDTLYNFSMRVKDLLVNKKKIGGIEQLQSNFKYNKPEVTLDINRSRANMEGITTKQISDNLRTALFGKEVTQYKFGKTSDDYPVNVRLMKKFRDNIELIKNVPLTINSSSGLRQIPISVFGNLKYSNTFASINRKNQKRIITLSSNVLNGFNANEVVKNIEKTLNETPKPEGITIKMGGEQEDQAETQSFLGKAFFICIGLIFLVLVGQFNSISQPVIIMTEILFSITGVLLGFAFTGMDVSIVMTGLGVITLAGVIVNNGILILEFINEEIKAGKDRIEAIVEGCKTRLTPIVLTMATATLGLFPTAFGLNIDFASLLNTGDPKIFFGGDSSAFWKPLSWTLIFGLSFGTLISLFLVPVLYLLTSRLKNFLKIKR